MGKIILGSLIRYGVTLLIGFLVARHMLAEDVARKLYAGDTVELWGGAWTVSLKQIVDFFILSAIPVAAPVAFAIWARIKDKYRVLIARLIPQKVSAGVLEDIIADTPKTQIIKAVATQKEPAK